MVFGHSSARKKKKKRQLERKWRKSGLNIDKDIYTRQCNIHHELLSDAKSRYHIDEISECDDRNLFRLVDKLCRGSKVSKLPQHENPKDLADKFADFF